MHWWLWSVVEQSGQRRYTAERAFVKFVPLPRRSLGLGRVCRYMSLAAGIGVYVEELES